MERERQLDKETEIKTDKQKISYLIVALEQ
jgi:hypothetical protein